jgi:threonine dehydrogenase-like Zn-dependent dehydrogenase
MLGYSHLTGGYPGAQAEYTRVPYADVNCLPVPDYIPDETALYLSDIIPTSYFGTELGGVKQGSTVAIWGQGPVGLLIARWCQIKGASKIIGIDCVPERLAVAQNVLGINVINFKLENVKTSLDALVPGGPEIAIEAAGPDYPKSLTHKIETAIGLETDACDILTEMISCVKKFGTVSIIGAYAGLTNHFPIGAMMEKGLTMNGGQCPTQKYWPVCLEKIRTGEMNPAFVVSHKGTLADGPELYKKFYRKEDGVIKVFLRPGQTA